MKTTETVTFTVRARPMLLQRATELARQRGIRRNRLFIKLLEQELARADRGQQPTDPAKEETHHAPA